MSLRDHGFGPDEIDAELEFHLARLEDELRTQGLPPEVAAAEARRRFGDRAAWRRACLEPWRSRPMIDRTLQLAPIVLILILGGYVTAAHRSHDRSIAELRRSIERRAVPGGGLERVDMAERLAAVEAELVELRETIVALPAADPTDRTQSIATISGGEAFDPTDIVRLNRTGQWAEAERVAERVLSSAVGDAVPTERGQVLLSLAYARMRRGDETGSRSALAEFERSSHGLPAGHWLRKQARGIEDELGDGGASSGTKPDDAATGLRHRWSVETPASHGLDGDVVERHRALAEATGADTCLLVHRGAIVSEWTREGFEPPVYAMSSTKSITSLLVGCLIDDGRLEGIDVTVGHFLPEWNEGVRKDVTLRDLLAHTSGLPKLEGSSVGFESDKNTFVRAQVPTSAPGTSFAYSNEGVQLLSPILDLVAGEPIQDYAERRLFRPLGMLDTRFQLDAEGHAWTYADLNTTPRDMARIGQLMLQRGEWQGERIVSEAWIADSTRAAQSFREDCGLLWWIHEDPPGFAALGYLHTDIHVFPDLELVAVRTQSRLAADAPYPEYREGALALFRELVSAK